MDKLKTWEIARNRNLTITVSEETYEFGPLLISHLKLIDLDNIASFETKYISNGETIELSLKENKLLIKDKNSLIELNSIELKSLLEEIKNYKFEKIESFQIGNLNTLYGENGCNSCKKTDWKPSKPTEKES